MEFLTIAQSTQHIQAGQYILGGICHTAVSDSDGTLFEVPLPVLEDEIGQQELYLTNAKPDHAILPMKGGTIRYSQTHDFVFGCITIEQSPAESIETTSLTAYRTMLQLCQQINMPNILRIWNFVSHINMPEGETERYRLFSAGRWQAFTEYQKTVNYGSPAACALGSFNQGSLKIAFLASTQIAQAIENPRQVSAYFYPKQYGTIPPVFSRAAIFRQSIGNTLFVSGTASVVGHESRHQHDLQAQTHETLQNLNTLLTSINAAEKNEPGEYIDSKQPWVLSELYCRVYIRHAADLPIVKKILQQANIKQAIYLQADICRAELLLEIEAVASHLQPSLHNKNAA